MFYAETLRVGMTLVKVVPDEPTATRHYVLTVKAVEYKVSKSGLKSLRRFTLSDGTAWRADGMPVGTKGSGVYTTLPFVVSYAEGQRRMDEAAKAVALHAQRGAA